MPTQQMVLPGPGPCGARAARRRSGRRRRLRSRTRAASRRRAAGAAASAPSAAPRPADPTGTEADGATVYFGTQLFQILCSIAAGAKTMYTHLVGPTERNDASSAPFGLSATSVHRPWMCSRKVRGRCGEARGAHVDAQVGDNMPHMNQVDISFPQILPTTMFDVPFVRAEQERRHAGRPTAIVRRDYLDLAI